MISLTLENPRMAYRLGVRISTLVLGFVAMSWGLATLPIFWRQSSVEQLASRVVERDPFSREFLLSRLSGATFTEKPSDCRPAGLRSAAIIRLRMAEQALADRDRSAIDGTLLESQAAIRRSLACSPTDSFLWLGLFWVTNAREGFNSRNLDYLRLSYRQGPNEGWIAIIRNRMTLALFASLPDDLKEKATLEFLAFIRTGLTEAAADIFIGSSSTIRDVLLTRVRTLDVASRQVFANSLRYRGFDDVNLPGIVQPEKPLWQQ